MASVQTSRFSLLKVEDDFDDEEHSAKNKQTGGNKGQSQGGAKKKNKKKKKQEQQRMESDELRNMAFGTGGGKKRPTSSSHAPDDNASDKQWDEWKKLDADFAQGEYEKSLQQALLMSKLDYEETKEVMSAVKDDRNGVSDHTGSKKGKNKKKKDKPSAMSLDQFNQMNDIPTNTKPPQSDDSEDDPLPVRPEIKTEVSEPDPTFFDSVKKDVDKIIQKEKIQEEYKMQYALGSALTSQHQEEMAEKDRIIEKLKKENKAIKNELKQAKERNQSLCHILSQGEMKNKTKILTELEELRKVHGELTQEVSDLNEGLEKERSKVHQLTAEISKHKTGKHGTK